MPEADLKQVLAAMEPKTKAAKLRELMPMIEQKISAGIRIADILDVLLKGGLDINQATLKSYLYRFRKKQIPSRSPSATVRNKLPLALDKPQQNKVEVSAFTSPAVSVQLLDQTMKPDPIQNAADIALYERVGKQHKRSRKP